MTREFDPKKSYLAIKAHEKMIAYVSFKVEDGQNYTDQEGVIKISSFQRPYGGGTYTLTFIVDTNDDKDLKETLKKRFDSLNEASLKPYLGKDMQRVVKVSLDSLEKIPEWYVEEVSVHLSKMDERANVLIEEKLMPALAASLSISFDPVQWWPADKPVREPEEMSFMEQLSLKALFKRWFRGAEINS
ncbi:MAG: hypothetical protein PVI38_10240 [Desulfobacterales bacterium]|jgi:hypothetical protein